MVSTFISSLYGNRRGEGQKGFYFLAGEKKFTLVIEAGGGIQKVPNIKFPYLPAPVPINSEHSIILVNLVKYMCTCENCLP